MVKTNKKKINKSSLTKEDEEWLAHQIKQAHREWDEEITKKFAGTPTDEEWVDYQAQQAQREWDEEVAEQIAKDEIEREGWLNIQKEKKKERVASETEKEVEIEKLKQDASLITGVEKVKEESNKATQLTTVDKFISLVEMKSHENKMASKHLFHCILGQSLIKIPLYVGYNKIDTRWHFFWMQDSQSGKGLSLGVFNDVVKKLKKVNVIMSVNGEKKAVLGSEFEVIEYDNVTTASLLNEWKRKKNNEVELDEQGEPILIRKKTEDADFLCMSEAISLFSSSPYAENLITFFIKTANSIYSGSDHIFYRNLSGYPIECPTSTNATIVLTTRHLQNLDVMKLGSGLMARVGTNFTHVSPEMRARIDAKICNSMWVIKDKQNKAYDELVQEVALDIMEDTKFAYLNKDNIKPKNAEELSAYTYKRIDDFRKRVLKELSNPELKSIVNSMIEAYHNHIFKLSFHSAILRRSIDIEKIDVEYAFNMLDEMFTHQTRFLELTAKTPFDEQAKIDKRTQTIKDFFMKNKVERKIVDLDLNELAIYVARNLRISHFHARKIIEDLTLDEYPLLTKTDHPTDKRKKRIRLNDSS